MKKWNDLTSDQQIQAVKRNLKNAVLNLIDGNLKLDGKRQAVLDSMVEHSTSIESATKRIMLSPIGKELRSMATIASEDAIYNEFGMQITEDSFDENFPMFV